MMAITTACQKEAFPLDGRTSQLGTGNAWNLSKPDIDHVLGLAKLSIQNPSKPNMRSRMAGGSIAFTDAKIITLGRATNATEKRVFLPLVEGAEGFSDITTREGEGFYNK